MTRTSSRWATAVLLATAGLAMAQPEQVAPPEEVVIPQGPTPMLFIDDEAVAAPAFVPGDMIQVKSIRLDRAALARLRVGDGVVIAPERQEGDVWIVQSVERPAPNVHIVRLRHLTDESGYAAFLTYDDATAMTLQVASRRATYRLQFAGGGAYHVWKVNQDNLVPEGTPLPMGEIPPRITPPDEVPPMPPGGYDDRNPGGCGGANPVADIMIVYTAAARDGIGGTSAMRAEAALAVDHFNTAAIASSMTTRMRLVYCDLINYTGAGDHDTDLPRLRSTNDGFIDGVHTTRDNVNADIVELVLDYGSGLGYCPSGAPTYSGSPFNTVAYWRMAGTFTTAHECGHNYGGGHDAAVEPPCGPAYGAGWRWTGNDSNGYCSVIAYPTSFYTRVLQYSNPNVNFMGVPTGNAASGHNARVILDNGNTMEGFELTRYDIYVNFSYAGIEIGTPAFPYNTMAEGVTNIDTPNTGAGELPTLYVTSGTQTYQTTITKAMTIIPCGGSVTLN